MGILAIKRVYDPPSSEDGYRVLVDRLWPRGMTKEQAGLDLWAKDVAPSPGLRKEFNHRPERFAEFTRHYLAELSRNPAVAAFRAELERPKITLLYGAHDTVNNHAVVLKNFLAGSAKNAARKTKTKRTAAKKLSRKPAKKKTKKKKARRQAAAARNRSR